MNFSPFLKTCFFAVILSFFVSCDKDFNEIGSGIIGDDHFGLDLDTSTSVVAYNQKLGAVQTNDLPINSLGYYNNPVFGKTKASFVTQLELKDINPTIGNNPTVKSVLLEVPYFSTKTATESGTGNGTYRLDSIYGNAKIKLDIFASNYFLRDNDAASGFTEEQAYYSNQSENNFDNALADPIRLNNSIDPAQNDQFFFNPAEIVNYKTNEETNVQEVESREAPKMKLDLRTDFFQSKFFTPGVSSNFVNNNLFKDYFRGLYFKVAAADNSSEQGSLAQINFGEGTIKITYEVDEVVEGVNTRVEKTLIVNMSGHSVNLFDNTDAPNYVSGTTNPDIVNGDERLFLKGGEGSIAVIDLFGPSNDGDEIPDQLQEIRSRGWLINEANLTFYIDRSAMSGAPEPNRIYLYNMATGAPLIDYIVDNSNGITPKFNRTVFSGILTKDDDNARGLKYKIRITNHIKNLLKDNLDAKNVRLGLVVTESINISSAAKLKTPLLTTIKTIPDMSVANPLGTILIGSNIPTTSADYANRVKLEIYYTKPN